MLHCPSFFSLTEYEYYYDLVTESPSEESDLSLDDWLYELLDLSSKLPLLPVCAEFMHIVQS